MKITPLYDYIQLDIQEAKLGGLKTDSVKTGQEYATILALGPDVKNQSLKVGQVVFVNAWAVEPKLYEGITYYFVSEERSGIVALIK